MNFEIDKKQIEIFYNETENKKIPVIILNTFSGESNKVWEECKKLNAKDFILVASLNIEQITHLKNTLLKPNILFLFEVHL